MSKHKQFGPRSTGVRGLEIERQGSWIEKETRQEKKARTRELFFAQNPRTWHEIQNKQKQKIKIIIKKRRNHLRSGGKH